MNFLYEILYYLAAAVAVIFIFAPHEFAHAFTAYKCGDGTAKMYGRLTLNPIKHLDPFGYVLCVLTGFGWAKPVPINPSNFRNYKRGMFLTAIAGVVTNYIIAFIAYPLFILLYHYGYAQNLSFFAQNEFLEYIVILLSNIFYLIYLYGMCVFVFNLLPFEPLDGFRVVEALTRQVNPVQRFLRMYGRYILIILVLESFLCNVLVDYAGISFAQNFNILYYVQWFATNIIGYPITALWDFVLLS